MSATKLNQVLKSGEVALGIGNYIGSLELTEIMGLAGMDFCYIDMHQSPLGFETVQRVISAADAVQMSTIVRMADHDPTAINRALNLGPNGIVVPHIKTRAEAQAVIHAAKYAPLGNRGACWPTRAAHYTLMPWNEYAERANAETFVAIMIEEAEALNNLDEILSVEGIDGVLVGGRDLSESLGLRGRDFTEPGMNSVLTRIASACRERGIVPWCSSTSGTPPQVLIEAGVQMVHFGLDLTIFAQACRSLVSNFRQPGKR